MKRHLIKFQLRLFGRCYCATSRPDSIDHLRDLGEFTFAVPTRSWAERTAQRREKKSGVPWTVTKWQRS